MRNDQVNSGRQTFLKFMEAAETWQETNHQQRELHPYEVKTSWEKASETYHANALHGIECWEPSAPYYPFRGQEDDPVYIYFKRRDDAILYKLIYG